MKLISSIDGFMLYGNLGVDFFSTSELLYPNMKFMLRLIRARPSSYVICNNPYVKLGISDWSLYTRRIALKDDYHKKPKDMLAYTSLEINYSENLAKNFIIPSRQNQFIQENISTMVQFDGLLLQRIQILHSLHDTLKMHSGINNLTSDK